MPYNTSELETISVAHKVDQTSSKRFHCVFSVSVSVFGLLFSYAFVFISILILILSQYNTGCAKNRTTFKIIFKCYVSVLFRKRTKQFDIWNTFLCPDIHELQIFEYSPVFHPPCVFTVYTSNNDNDDEYDDEDDDNDNDNDNNSRSNNKSNSNNFINKKNQSVVISNVVIRPSYAIFGTHTYEILAYSMPR